MSLGLKPVAVAMLALLALPSLSCGRSRAPEPTRIATATPQPTPTSVSLLATLERSGKVMEVLESFHFRLHHESGNMELIAGLVIDEAEGDVVRPDNLSVSFKGSAGGIAIRTRLITIGDDGYMTNPMTGVWEAGPTGVSSLEFFDPSRGIAAIMQQLSQVRLVDVAARDSRVYAIAGNLPAEALSPLVGSTLEDATVSVELTIDAERLHLLGVRIAGRVMPTDEDGVIRIITLTSFDERIAIEAPL